MYRIFLSDNSNYVELDTEDISMETVFSISDISDISSRKDTITKNITFKGTQTNNKAFGSLYFLNRNVDVSLDKSIFFNYSPLKRVDCKVYEDSMLILNGYLIITDVGIDAKGSITYNATITGKLIGFKQALGSSKLTDIDFTDLKHQYNKAQIVNSWGIGDFDTTVGEATQRYDPVTDTYYYEPFKLGSGYVYPFIDYGEKFLDESYNSDYTHISIGNYRPAIYVSEYLNRIFKQVGFTWEIKGSEEFIDQFNRLIIPSNEERLTTIGSGNPSIYTRDGSVLAITQSTNPIKDSGSRYMVHPLPIPLKTGVPAFTDYGVQFGTTDKDNTIIQFTKAVKTDAYLSLTIEDIENRIGSTGIAVTADIIMELVRRKYSTDSEDVDANWEILGTESFQVEVGGTRDTIALEVNILPTQFEIGDQLNVRIKDSIWWTGSSLNTPNDACKFSITNIQLNLPKNINDSYIITAKEDDYIIPKAPEDVQQIDFVKSILSLFNLYLYNTKENPYHLILQSYNEYYSECYAPDLYTSAINWTDKVNYSKNITVQGNINLPKKYVFTFTEDGDYLNKTYKDKYGEVMGAYTLADSLGVNDEKTVQVIFSPTPSVEMPNLNRMYPLIADGGTSLKDKKPLQSNIRVLYYNGGAYTTLTTYSEDAIDDDKHLSVVDRFAVGIYANASNYRFDINSDHTNKISTYTPVVDINFGTPNEFYFNTTSSYLTVPATFQYYKGMLEELTNANLFLIECNVLLNEADVSNLDLSIPVFIDMGELGYSYFKVIQVTYADSNTPSKVVLQKITP